MMLEYMEIMPITLRALAAFLLTYLRCIMCYERASAMVCCIATSIHPDQSPPPCSSHCSGFPVEVCLISKYKVAAIFVHFGNIHSNKDSAVPNVYCVPCAPVGGGARRMLGISMANSTADIEC